MDLGLQVTETQRRIQEIEALGAQAAGDAGSRRLLLELLQGQGKVSLRAVAARVLAESLPDNGEVRDALLQICSHAPEWSLRKAALRAACQSLGPDPALSERLSTAWEADPHHSVRCEALKGLAALQGQDPKLRRRLFLAARDPTDIYWHAAVEALGAWSPDDPEARGLLLGLAQKGVVRWKRSSVIARLVDHLGGDPEVEERALTWLEDRDAQVRQACIESASPGLKTTPAFAGRLLRLAAADRDSEVRHAALEALAEHHPSHPELPALLLGIIREPKAEVRQHLRRYHGDIRIKALALLLRFSPEDETSLEVLLEVSERQDKDGLRGVALLWLARGFLANGRARARVFEAVRMRSHFGIRGELLDWLASESEGDREVEALLLDACRNGDDPAGQRMAASALAKHRLGSPEVLDQILSLASDATDPVKSCTFAALLFRCCPEDPRAEKAYLDALRRAADADTRRSMLYGLESLEHRSPALKAVLLQAFTEESLLPLRKRVLAGLRSYAEDRDVRDLLVEVARSEAHPELRTLAIEGGAAIAVDDPELTALLSDRLREDPDPQARSAAAKALAALWSSDAGGAEEIKALVLENPCAGPGGEISRWLPSDFFEQPEIKTGMMARARREAGTREGSGLLGRLFELCGPAAEFKELLLDCLQVHRKSAGPREMRQEVGLLFWCFPRDPETLAVARRILDGGPGARDRCVYPLPGDSGSRLIMSIAAEHLAVYASEEPETLEQLFKAAETEWRYHGQEQSAALCSSLVKHFGALPRVRELLFAKAGADGPDELRKSLLSLLAEHYRDDPGCQTLLKDLARPAQTPADSRTRPPRSSRGTAVAGHALGLLGRHFSQDPAVLELVLERASSAESDWSRCRALDVLAQDYGERPEAQEMLIERSRNDPEEVVRKNARHHIHELELEAASESRGDSGRRSDDAELAELLEELRGCQGSARRSQLMSRLAELAGDDLKGILLAFLETELPLEVQAAVIVRLGEWLGDDPGLRKLFLDSFRDPRFLEKADWLYQLVAQKLGQKLCGDPEIEGLLQDSASAGPDRTRRLAALETLFTWPALRAAARDLARRIVAEDADDEVRAAALKALSQSASHVLPLEQAETIRSALLTALKQDKAEVVRLVALEALKQRFARDPETLQAFLGACRDDPSDEVRRQTLSALLRVFPDYPETKEVLLPLALFDSDEAVRRMALESLAKQRPGDASLRTLRFLMEPEGLPKLARKGKLRRPDGLRPPGAEVRAALQGIVKAGGAREAAQAQKDRVQVLLSLETEDVVDLAVQQIISRADAATEEETWLAALDVLGRLCPEDPGTGSLVCRLARQEEAPDALGLLCDHLAICYGGLSETKAVFGELVRRSEAPPFGLWAFLKMLLRFSWDSGTRRELVNLVTLQMRGKLTSNTLERAQTRLENKPQALRYLEQLTPTDQGLKRRLAAARSFVTFLERDHEAVQDLCGLVSKDPNPVFRLQVLCILARQHARDPRLRARLVQLVKDEKDTRVREQMAFQLSFLMPHDPELRRLGEEALAELIPRARRER